MKQLTQFITQLFTQFIEDDAFTLAAALSYYTVFSIAPILVIVLAVSSLFFGAEAVSGNLYLQLDQLLGQSTAAQVQNIIQNVYTSGQTPFATFLSVSILLFSATAVVNQLKNALNVVWKVTEPPYKGILGYLKVRFLSLIFVIGLGFIFLVSLGVNAIMNFFSDAIIKYFPIFNDPLNFLLPYVLLIGVTLLIFAFLFYYLPDSRVTWQNASVGAIFTTILFLFGKYLIGFYIANSDVATIFGSAGALVSLMLWVYYSSVILILGAKFTYLWSMRSMKID